MYILNRCLCVSGVIRQQQLWPDYTLYSPPYTNTTTLESHMAAPTCLELHNDSNISLTTYRSIILKWTPGGPMVSPLWSSVTACSEGGGQHADHHHSVSGGWCHRSVDGLHADQELDPLCSCQAWGEKVSFPNPYLSSTQAFHTVSSEYIVAPWQQVRITQIL